jgi:hypothetical protein
MRVELVPPDSDTEPRHWVRHDQAFAMMLRPGSIEWGSKRSALKKFDYTGGDLALCDRHVGEWVGLMNVSHLQLGISDAALMASSDGAYGEVELRPSRKFADSRLSALVAAARAEMVAGFPSGRLFLDSVEQAMAVALVKDHAVRHRPVQVYRGGLGTNGSVARPAESHSRMTNGTVQKGNSTTLVVQYQEGSKTISVPTNVPVTLVAPEKVTFATGDLVYATTEKLPNGTLVTDKIFLFIPAAASTNNKQ